MRAIRTWGSVRGVPGNWYPYRDLCHLVPGRGVWRPRASARVRRRSPDFDVQVRRGTLPDRGHHPIRKRSRWVISRTGGYLKERLP